MPRCCILRHWTIALQPIALLFLVFLLFVQALYQNTLDFVRKFQRNIIENVTKHKQKKVRSQVYSAIGIF